MRIGSGKCGWQSSVKRRTRFSASREEKNKSRSNDTPGVRYDKPEEQKAKIKIAIEAQRCKQVCDINSWNH
jgi:hypothetical protein